jgi:ankyrin repeat protein
MLEETPADEDKDTKAGDPLDTTVPETLSVPANSALKSEETTSEVPPASDPDPVSPLSMAIQKCATQITTLLSLPISPCAAWSAPIGVQYCFGSIANFHDPLFIKIRKLITTRLSNLRYSTRHNLAKLKLQYCIGLHDNAINTPNSVGLRPLHRAIISGDKSLVYIMLSSGAGVNLCTGDGTNRHPLHLALEGNKRSHLDIAKAICSQPGVCKHHIPHPSGITPLMIAAKRGYTDIVNRYILGCQGVAELADFIDLKDNTSHSALVYACINNNLAIAKLIIEKGADVNSSTEEGKTAIMYASKLGHTKIAQLLLEKGADLGRVYGRGMTALMIAAEKGYLGVVVAVLSREGFQGLNERNAKGSTALHLAAEGGWAEVAREGCREVVGLLVRAGADMDAKDNEGMTALQVAANKGRKGISVVFSEAVDRGRNEAVMRACRHGRVDVVQMLLSSSGVDVNARHIGATALIWASEKGEVEIVQELLKIAEVEVNLQDGGGSTALIRAIVFGFTEIVRLLLQRKDVDVNIKEGSGTTALMWACKKQKKEIVELLLARKDTDVNAIGGDGKTALLFAVEFARVFPRRRDYDDEIVKIVLGREDVDVEAKDKEGMGVLGLARVMGFKKAEELILERMERGGVI